MHEQKWEIWQGMATIKKLRNSRVEKYHNRTEEFNRVSEVDLTMKSQWPGG